MPTLTVTKNYDDGLTPTEQMLDDIKSSIETWANTTKLDADNLQSNAATTAKYAALSVGSDALAANAVTTAKILDANVTILKRAALGQQVSASCGAYTSTSSSFVSITNLTVTITTTGRPVHLMLIPGETTTTSGINASSSSTGTCTAHFQFVRDATVVSLMSMGDVKTNATNSFTYIPCSSLSHIDTPSAGTYVYILQGKILTGSSFECLRAKLVAYEL